MALKVIISKNVLWRDAGSELVLFDDRTARYYALNEIGSQVWRGIAAGSDLGDLTAALAGVYQAPHDVIAQDVNAFVTNALALNLLTEQHKGLEG